MEGGQSGWTLEEAERGTWGRRGRKGSDPAGFAESGFYPSSNRTPETDIMQVSGKLNFAFLKRQSGCGMDSDLDWSPMQLTGGK